MFNPDSRIDEMKYWFWELVCIGQKCFMTGAISIVTPGSPVQLMFATLIMMFYLLAVLKAAPYVSATDDWMAVLTTLSIVISLFFGLLLLTDDKIEPNFQSETIGSFLVSMNLSVLAIEILAVLASTKCGSRALVAVKCHSCIKAESQEDPVADGSRKSPSKTRVNPEPAKGNADEEDLKGLRSWG